MMEFSLLSLMVISVLLFFVFAFLVIRFSGGSWKKTGDIIVVKSAFFPLLSYKQIVHIDESNRILIIQTRSFFGKNNKEQRILISAIKKIGVYPVFFMIGKVIPFKVYDILFGTDKGKIKTFNFSKKTQERIVKYIEKNSNCIITNYKLTIGLGAGSGPVLFRVLGKE